MILIPRLREAHPLSRHPYRRPVRLLPFLLLVLSLVACDGVKMKFGDGDDEDDTPAEEQRIPVELTTLELGPIEAVLRFSTNLEAESAVAVHSQASRLVRELLVEEGQRVTKGQLLLRLQDDEQRSEVEQIEIQLAKARREYDRQQNLFTKELISEQAFHDATYEVERLELALDDARRRLSYTEVRAPIQGTVTRRLVNLGDTVQVNQHLFDLVDFDTIVARVFVPERELPRLAVGQEARIEAASAGSTSRFGRVDRIAPVVDPKSGTVKVTVAIPRSQGLAPGMYVEVALVVARRDDALLVPKQALIYDDVQAFAYRFTSTGTETETPHGDGEDPGDEPRTPSSPPRTFEAGTVERLRIQIALEDRRNIVPAGDLLAAGDRVVLAGQAGLEDGAKVRVVEGVARPASDFRTAAAEGSP